MVGRDGSTPIRCPPAISGRPVGFVVAPYIPDSFPALLCLTRRTLDSASGLVWHGCSTPSLKFCNYSEKAVVPKLFLVVHLSLRIATFDIESETDRHQRQYSYSYRHRHIADLRYVVKHVLPEFQHCMSILLLLPLGFIVILRVEDGRVPNWMRWRIFSLSFLMEISCMILKYI